MFDDRYCKSMMNTEEDTAKTTEVLWNY